MLLIVYLIFTLSPIVWLLLSTIQTQASLLRVPPHMLPQDDYLSANYVNIFKPAAFGENSGQSTFFLALRNSVLVALGTTAIAMIFGTLAAYAIARFNIPGRRCAAAARAGHATAAGHLDHHSAVSHVQD